MSLIENYAIRIAVIHQKWFTSRGKFYDQSNVNTRNITRANPKQNAVIPMKAWWCIIRLVNQQHSRFINRKGKSKIFSIKDTFPFDSNLNLRVNHDNPRSTKGASAKALRGKQVNFYMKKAFNGKVFFFLGFNPGTCFNDYHIQAQQTTSYFTSHGILNNT